jgi:predicted ester cyclase
MKDFARGSSAFVKRSLRVMSKPYLKEKLEDAVNNRSQQRMARLHLSKFVNIGLLLAVMLTFVSVSVHAQSAAPACEGDQLEKTRQFGLTFMKAFNAGNMDAWYTVLADDYQLHSSMVDFAPLDKDGALAAMKPLLTAFPGFQTEANLSLVRTDCKYVTYHWTSRGAFTGPFGDMQPTGNAFELSGINIAKVVNGQIVEEWNTFDRLTLLTQMGVMGGEATPEATAATGS